MKPLSERIRKLVPFGITSRRMLNEWADDAASLEKLREYATHIPGCHEGGNDCICGLDALLIGEENDSANV